MRGLKKMKKRVLITMLACLTLTAFAGCNSSSESGDTKSSGTVNVSAASEESEVSEESKAESTEISRTESREESKQESKSESSSADSQESSEPSIEESSSSEEPQESSREEASETEIPAESSEQSEAEPVHVSEEPSVVSEPDPVPVSGSFSASDLTFAFNGAQITPDDNMSSVLASVGDAQNVTSVPSCIGVGEDKIYSYGEFKIESYPNSAGERVLNITIEGSTVSTPKGIRVGMTADDVKAAYGTDALDPSSDDYILIYRSGSRHLDFLMENGVIFEIDYVLDV